MPIKFGEALQEPPVVEVPVINGGDASRVTAAPVEVQAAPVNMCTGSGNITGEITPEDVKAALKHTLGMQQQHLGGPPSVVCSAAGTGEPPMPRKA
jgi:hypothetical protein